MKSLLIILGVLSASILAGVVLSKHPGYLLIASNHWRIETTLWFGVISLLISLLLLWLVVRVLSRIWYAKTNVNQWLHDRRRHKSDQLSQQGLCELAESHWDNAEKKLIRAAKNSQTPLMNYLGAAKAAQHLQALTRRDRYLKQAIESTPDAEKAVGLTQATLQLEAQQYEQALATLQSLRQQYPQHKHVLLLLKQSYIELEDWAHLIELIPDLRRYRCLSKKQCQAVLLQAQSQQLLGSLQQAHPEAIHNTWQQMDASAQQDCHNAHAYARYLIQTGEHAQAETVLYNALQHEWHTDSICLWGTLSAPTAQTAYQKAEKWLKEHPQDEYLQQTLSQLAVELKLWGQAKNYLNTSIAQQPTAAKYFQLAAICEQCQESAQAHKHIQQGLDLLKT